MAKHVLSIPIVCITSRKVTFYIQNDQMTMVTCKHLMHSIATFLNDYCESV